MNTLPGDCGSPIPPLNLVNFSFHKKYGSLKAELYPKHMGPTPHVAADYHDRGSGKRLSISGHRAVATILVAEMHECCERNVAPAEQPTASSGLNPTFEQMNSTEAPLFFASLWQFYELTLTQKFVYPP
jgi:hypothetical protein